MSLMSQYPVTPEPPFHGERNVMKIIADANAFKDKAEEPNVRYHCGEMLVPQSFQQEVLTFSLRRMVDPNQVTAHEEKSVYSYMRS